MKGRGGEDRGGGGGGAKRKRCMDEGGDGVREGGRTGEVEGKRNGDTGAMGEATKG